MKGLWKIVAKGRWVLSEKLGWTLPPPVPKSREDIAADRAVPVLRGLLVQRFSDATALHLAELKMRGALGLPKEKIATAVRVAAAIVAKAGPLPKPIEPKRTRAERMAKMHAKRRAQRGPSRIEARRRQVERYVFEMRDPVVDPLADGQSPDALIRSLKDVLGPNRTLPEIRRGR